MKYIVALMFGFILLLGYVQYDQHRKILIIADGTISALTGVADQIIKNVEQDALIKQLTGTDYEQKEKALFRAFEPKPIEY